ncbi:hypothetical protein SAMN05216404_11517 [Nitrosospira multiformis]|uniref:Uncharacterized protein n=1 Tax=Nitrosospira multiformis TaxID=1231 RepID=A0A1H8N4L1_9PROT|nr:hypothetical protein SAMN05216404_11517 [Nitrosospira multiformis]
MALGDFLRDIQSKPTAFPSILDTVADLRVNGEKLAVTGIFVKSMSRRTQTETIGLALTHVGVGAVLTGERCAGH